MEKAREWQVYSSFSGLADETMEGREGGACPIMVVLAAPAGAGLSPTDRLRGSQRTYRGAGKREVERTGSNGNCKKKGQRCFNTALHVGSEGVQKRGGRKDSAGWEGGFRAGGKTKSRKEKRHEQTGCHGALDFLHHLMGRPDEKKASRH